MFAATVKAQVKYEDMDDFKREERYIVVKRKRLSPEQEVAHTKGNIMYCIDPHPDCPRCKGQGFYLRREGRGFYSDGSFGHNDWQDCTCDVHQKIDSLPKEVNPYRD